MKSPLPEKTPLFIHEPSGPVYRAPSLTYIKEANTFLAFAERRKNYEDVNAEYLVMRRGIYKTGYVKWEGIQPLHEATLKNHRSMNPCAVYEASSKVVFLFFNCIPIGVTEKHMRIWGNSSKLCYITSNDCGVTWSTIKDITEVTNPIRNMATFSVSPGHGIQTQAGKLIIPAYVHVAKFWFIRWWFGKKQSFYLYSEDQGHRWQISERITRYECGECELAEISNEGKNMLYCNARSTGNKRLEALSLNVGGEFKFVEKSKKLKETSGGCQGSIVSFLGAEQPGQDRNYWLLFSHPLKKDHRDLGVFLTKNPLVSESWSKPWVIYEGFGGYSNLVDCQEANTFAILFECGEETQYDKIDFCLFTLEDVLENIKKKKSLFARFKK
ncbi:sialidase-3-like [Spea bombifrons]|uniref:sialidase-3-like n=1 Tax=Spea bombifrons TaxID=233779 RepID=UPI00234A3C85|nr:sialidase-3-like [Spea bombifrons]